MKTAKVLLLACSLSVAPFMAMAQGPAQPTELKVPGVMTTAGKWFVEKCSDDALAAVANTDRRMRRCTKLLARWHHEAELREAQRENPRLLDYSNVAASGDANLPFDTVAQFRNMPLVYSYHLD